MEGTMDPDRNPIEAELAALDAVQAPDSLRHAVQVAVRDAARAPARRGLRLPLARPRAFVLAGGSLAALVVVLALVLGGGGGATGPTVADAARAALGPATAPAPPARPGGHLLTASLDGIVYPTWTRSGWRAVGERNDTLAGRHVRTVLYTAANGARVGYAIAAGDALPLPGGRVVRRRGVAIRVLAIDGANVVTWRRDGHTCVLAARGVDAASLVRFASYST
jgi:hypothetical protein